MSGPNFDASNMRESCGRIICRFSCGAASAVATKLTLAKHAGREVVIHYSDTRSEHPDNERFLTDCERWFGRSIERLHPKGEDLQGLRAEHEHAVAEGHAPNHDILKGDAGQPNKRGATSHDRDNNASGKGIE